MELKKAGGESRAGELRLEMTVELKKVGVRSLAGELRSEPMVESPRLAGNCDMERPAFGVSKRFESIGREAETRMDRREESDGPKARLSEPSSTCTVGSVLSRRGVTTPHGSRSASRSWRLHSVSMSVSSLSISAGAWHLTRERDRAFADRNKTFDYDRIDSIRLSESSISAAGVVLTLPLTALADTSR